MPIISVRDNKSKRWKRNAKKKTKTKKEKVETEAIMMKGWELNDFVVHLS